jgi:hypothetical protein
VPRTPVRAVETLGIVLVLKAFSSGCTAVTAVHVSDSREEIAALSRAWRGQYSSYPFLAHIRLRHIISPYRTLIPAIMGYMDDLSEVRKPAASTAVRRANPGLLVAEARDLVVHEIAANHAGRRDAMYCRPQIHLAAWLLTTHSLCSTGRSSRIVRSSLAFARTRQACQPPAPTGTCAPW